MKRTPDYEHAVLRATPYLRHWRHRMYSEALRGAARYRATYPRQTPRPASVLERHYGMPLTFTDPTGRST